MNFAVSAPGKVILNGEHSVVYGKAAIAGTVGLRNTLKLQTNPSPTISIKLDILQHELVCDLKDFNSLLEVTFSKYKDQNLPNDLNHNEFLCIIKEFVLKTKFHENFNIFDHANTLGALFYLLCGILISNKCSQMTEGLTISMKSGITTGAGLGSSASYGVCLAGAFYFYAKSLNSSNFINQFNCMSDVEQFAVRTVVSDWAFCSEKIMHGNPSGLDNTICTFGGLVKFYRNQKPTPLKSVKTLNILLIDSCVSRSTAAMVERVLKQKTQHARKVEEIFDEIEKIVNEVAKVLEDESSIQTQFVQLSKLFEQNNTLLTMLDASHIELDNIKNICSRYGLSSKLTGAGGGGYAIAILPEDFSQNADFIRLSEELMSAGYKVQHTIVGDDGFKVEILNN